MRAILLAGGYGTRLRPLTDTVPKCLAPIKGKPLLQIWLEQLSAADIGPFLVNTHYLAEEVNRFVHSAPWRDKITLVHEDVLLGTAGTLMANRDFFQGEDGILIHADNYCLASLEAFVESHHARPRHCVMTMMVFHTDAPSSCGIVELDGDGVVRGFHEKSTDPPGNIANGAVYILTAEMLREVASWKVCPSDFSTEIIPRYMGRIFTYQTQQPFIDIGTIAAYEKANALE